MMFSQIENNPQSNDDEQQMAQSVALDVALPPLEMNFDVQEIQKQGRRSIVHSRIPSTSPTLQKDSPNIILHQARKNLCFEIEYLRDIIEGKEVHWSNSFDQFCREIQTDRKTTTVLTQGNQTMSYQSQINSGGNPFYTIPEESKDLEKPNDILPQPKQTQIVEFIRRMFVVLNQMKKEFLAEERSQEKEKTEKALFVLSCYLERIRLYLDDCIYPRDQSLNILDIDIDVNSIKKQNMHFSDRQCSVTQTDFFTAYKHIRNINEKIKKMESKEVEEVNKESLGGRNSLQLSTQIGTDFQNQGDTSQINLSDKDIEDIKKQLRNNTGQIPKYEKFWKLIDFFSPSLLRFHDQNELLSKEIQLVVTIQTCNSKSYELNLSLFNDPLSEISNQAIVEPCQFYGQGYQTFIFQNISIKSLIANNLVLIMNAIETKSSKLPSQTKELLSTTSQFSILKNYKGYTILPLTKLFWSKSIKNGVSQEIIAKFYRSSPNFRIEERYMQLLEKNTLSKYKDQYLSTCMDLKYTFHIATRVSNEELKDATVIKKINFDVKDNISKDKDYISKVIKKEENRFNDVKVNLVKLILADKICKGSPLVRIELSLRDNYGIVYDTVYMTICQNDFAFAQTYESLIYATAPEIHIFENLFIRIPTKSIETLKKLYIIFFVQTLAQGKDSKGNKIKPKTFASEMENLQFKTELFGVIPLYDTKKDQESILKNMLYQITLRHMNVEKFKTFKKHEQIINFDLCNECYLRIGINVISNEFTHNRFINNLMVLNEKNAFFQHYETILNDLKHIQSEELIYFHDKILDKLFQLITFSKSPISQDLVFETIIQIIQVFYNQYKDYKELLNNYLQNHFAHSKAYIPLLHQIRQTAEIVRQGFKAENEFQNEECLLSTMKYLSIILRLMRLSFLEEQQCTKQIGSNANSPTKSGMDNQMEGEQQQDLQPSVLGFGGASLMPSRIKYDAYLNLKNSMIEEEEEEGIEHIIITNQYIDDLTMSKIGAANMNLQQSINQYQEGVIKKSLMRKKDIRQTIKNEGLIGKIELNKNDFLVLLQRSVHSIFEGCHKDSMKSTLSLRAILYENIVEILDQITEFIDDKFFSRIMSFIYEDPIYGFQNAISTIRRRAQNSEVQKSIRPAFTSFSIVRPDQNRRSELIEDYVTKKNFLEGLKDYSFINEEYITKQKIIAMGNILNGGILEKIRGNSDRVVISFCEHIESTHLRKTEYSTHVFYFLHQLFAYLNRRNDQTLLEDSLREQKQKLLNHKPLDLSGFFTKILPELTTYLRKYFKENNAQLRIKEDKNLESTLSPFYEKTSLIIMSVANEVTKERMKEFLIHDPERLHTLLDNLKKLLKRMTFMKPYDNFFEKKKIQVIRKINDFTFGLLIETLGDNISPDYHKIISICRVLFLIVSCKQSQIKLEYLRTVRANALVKDQLPLRKTSMFRHFKMFWTKFKHIGQPWIQLQCLTKDFSQLVKQGFQKPMKRFMDTFSEIAEQEYQSTQNISYSSNCIFNIYNELLQSTEGEYEVNQNNFYNFFEKCIKNTETFKHNTGFQKIVDNILDQMKKLGEAMREVNNCKRNTIKNAFYETYCQALLMDLLWELKLFKLFNQNKQSFKNLHQNLGAFTEQAFTDLRFLQIIQNSEDLQMQIGQREIAAMVQIDLMKEIAENLQKADMFEKAIEILGQMKELCENVLFDYDKVSKVLVEQSRIYKVLSEKPNRNYCVYFKIGFFGQNFPEQLRNSYFIYRGIKLATRPDILGEMKKHFPQIMMLNNTASPPQEILDGSQQYFQIEVVQPLTYKEMLEFNLDETTKDKEEIEQAHKFRYLPDKYKVYYKENFKNKFYKETIVKKNLDDDMQSDILIEIFKVKSKFPTIFKMQKIINTKNIILNAIDKATIIVEQMNEKITQCGQAINQMQSSQNTNYLQESSGLQMNVDKLQSLIRGTLESPISGGVKRIIHTFINEEYLLSQDKPKVLELFLKIEEHGNVLKDAIHQFSQVNDDDRITTKLDKDYEIFKGEIDEIKQYVDEIACKQTFDSFSS